MNLSHPLGQTKGKPIAHYGPRSTLRDRSEFRNPSERSLSLQVPSGQVVVNGGGGGCTVTLPATSCTFNSKVAGPEVVVTATYGGSTLHQGSSGEQTLLVYPSCSGGVVTIQTRTFPGGESFLCQGSSSITTNGAVQVESGSHVEFQAPVIRLEPGFNVAPGAEFQAGE